MRAKALKFHMRIFSIRTFPWVPSFLPCGLILRSGLRFEYFDQVNARALIFYMNIPCDKTSPWVLLFFTLWPWGLTHYFENFNLTNNFWTVRARALIFHMSIPCDKTFPWVPLFFLPCYLKLGVWPIFWKLTFVQWMLELWYSTWVFVVSRPFSVYQHFYPVTLILEFDLIL